MPPQRRAHREIALESTRNAGRQLPVTEPSHKLRFTAAYLLPVAVYLWLLALWAVLALLLPAASFTAARLAVLGWLLLVAVAGATTALTVRCPSPLAIAIFIVGTGLTLALTTLWLPPLLGGLAVLVFLVNAFKAAVDWPFFLSGSGTLGRRRAFEIRHALLVVLEAASVTAGLALV